MILPEIKTRREWSSELKMPTLYNTATKTVEAFIPTDPNQVSVYTCGPTVYSAAHIGNMRSYIFADTLRRVLELHGFNLKHVMNITDVGHLTSDADAGEDKMEVSKAKEGVSAWSVANKYTQLFFAHSAKLNIQVPHVVCKATDYIPQQIALVEKLEANGFTYQTADGVYFDSQKFASYGDLARLDLQNLEAGHRVEIGDKKNPSDFALWKFSPVNSKRDMEWESPWGVGFPGWHIECSAMAMSILGPQIDIHTGGVDHIPVHHTNEIAQSECATGHTPFVKYWMHGEFLILKDDVKMGKSKGNVLTVDTLEENGCDPLAFRFLCLSSSYRKQLHFSWKALDSAATGLKRLQNIINELYKKATEFIDVSDEKHKEIGLKVLKMCGEDLDTAKLLAHIWDTVGSPAESTWSKLTTVAWADEILGLKLIDTAYAHARENSKLRLVPCGVSSLLAERDSLRAERKFTEADKVRQQLVALGWDVSDSASGPQLKRI